MRSTTDMQQNTPSTASQFITFRGTTGIFTVACTDQGEGPPVVLLHCNSSSRHQWRPLIGELSTNYRVLAVDLFGHGDSPLPGLPATFTVEDEVAMIAALIDRAGEAVHLVGHSYGGAIALKAALALQRDVRSLNLIEPATFELLRHAGDEEPWQEIQAVASRHITSIGQGSPEHAADGFMGYWIGKAAWNGMPEARREAIHGTMPAVARAWEIILSESTGLGDYARMNVPTLLVQGEGTHAPCARVCAMLAANLPHCETAVIRDAGHMAPITHAEPVNAAIAAHLQR